MRDLIGKTSFQHHEIMRVFRRIVDETGVNAGIQDPKSFIDLIAENIHHVSGEIPATAKGVIDRTPQSQQGKQSVAIAAGAFYLAADIVGHHVKQDSISAAANVSNLTIRNRYQEMEAELQAQSRNSEIQT